jgi:hypothetical protein
MFDIAAGDEWWLALLRTNVLPPIANYILRLDSVRNYIFPLLSQIGINYRHSSLSRHTGDEDFSVKAGDRMPYVVLEGRSVYERLQEPKFHLLTFYKHGELEKRSIDMTPEYAGLIDIGVFQITSDVIEKFGTERPFTVFLRPDNYIGFISTERTSSDVGSYLSELIQRSYKP